MSMALNPDRATLNFLNAFPEEIRLRGEKLQKDGAVTQIFGNHLYIQGRVEDAYGVHRVNLRLQGNRWFGACSTEDEDLAGAAMYAAMLERMYRGQDLPESPNELNDVPLLDILEEKLGRELDDKEADYVSKLEKRYRRFAIEQEIHDHDMVRLNPRWEIVSYDPLELWPVPPTNILEFWNYIAYAFNKKRLPYPEFMESITDLEKVQRKIHEWERSREVGTWYDRIQSVNERPPQPPRGELFMRLVSTINEGHFEYRHSLKQDWIPVREKQDLEHLENLHERAAVRMDAQTEILLAAGKLRREVVQPLAQPHAAQGLGGVQRVAADLAGKFHVFQCGQVLHQVVELEHKAHIVPAVGGQLPGGKAAHVAAVQPDVALVAVVHAAQNVQQGGLARAGGPHDDAELALVHIEIQVVCGSDLHTAGLVIFTDIFKLHKMLHGVFPFCQNAKYFNLNIA